MRGKSGKSWCTDWYLQNLINRGKASRYVPKLSMEEAIRKAGL